VASVHDDSMSGGSCGTPLWAPRRDAQSLLETLINQSAESVGPKHRELRKRVAVCRCGDYARANQGDGGGGSGSGERAAACGAL
jgi:hypothetical protein